MTPRSSPIGSVLAIRSAASRSTLNVPIRLTSMTFLNASSGNGPSLPSVLTALPMPAQLTLMRSGPSDSATSSAAADGGFVGDVGLDELGAIAEFGDGLLAPEVDHDHLRARVEQSLRGRQAEPGGTAGDDGYGVFDLH